MIKLQKLLFPTDFSDYSDRARAYVVELSKKFGADVLLVHVMPIPTYAVGYEISIDLKTVHDEMSAAAQRRLDERAEALRGEGIKVETLLAVGTPFVEILAAARKNQTDLIVMPTHGYGAIKHLLLGSTAERVVRKAPCPVLTVRHPEHEFIHPSKSDD
jgi:nucleotide-binding universal stress UspA family protein